MAFCYDLSNRVAGQTLPGQRQVGFGHDASGNLTSLAPPGRPAHGFEYTPTHLVSSYTPPPAAGTGLLSTTYAYDLDGALTHVLLPDEGTIVPSYDPAGRLASVTTSRGTSVLGYDPAGRVETVTAPGGSGLGYTYDGSLVTSETTSGPIAGTVGWTYDSDLRVASTSVNGSPVSYGYDADSLLTAAGALTIASEPTTGRVSGTTLAGVATTSFHNDYGELDTFSASASGSGAYTYTVSRDAAGRISGKTETIQGTSTSYVYGYDDAGRLASVTRNGALTASYLYDDNGNRLSRTASGATEEGYYDEQDRMYQYGSATYAYRPNRALTTKTVAGATTWYDYDALGNLRAVALPDGRQIEYVVDGLNRRIGKKVNGGLVEGFLYEGQLRPVAWLNSAGQVYARFVYGLHANVPEYMVTADGTFRFITDHLGSPRLIVNATTGAVAQRIDYDEWGVVLSDSNPGFQPFGFAGGLYDRDTGLVRFGARDYDPSVGRWTAKDPLGFEGGLNFYEYAGGDPVNGIDPSGLYWVYSQSTGNLTHVDAQGNATLVGKGYAGYGSGPGGGLNNPAMQSVGAGVPEHQGYSFGPLPQGMYTIGPMVNASGYTQAMLLTPDPANEMFGRGIDGGFWIHGPHPNDNFDSSSGCIVASNPLRHQIANSGDNTLLVVP